MNSTDGKILYEVDKCGVPQAQREPRLLNLEAFFRR